MTSHANPTMSDLAGRLNPESPEACATCKILEESELLRDVTWLKDESSLRPISTLLRTTRSGASSQSHRHSADRHEMLGTLEKIAVVDKKLAELNRNDATWRAGEELPYLEAMSHDFERALFCGTMPRATERFHGFAERYARLDAKKAATAPNVIDAGGRGKNLTSIWLVGWSPSTCYCFYPKNTAAGLRIEDIAKRRPWTRREANSVPSRRATRGHSASRCGIGGTWSALPTSRSRSSSTLRASAPLRARRARPRRALRNIPSARS